MDVAHPSLRTILPCQRHHPAVLLTQRLHLRRCCTLALAGDTANAWFIRSSSAHGAPSYGYELNTGPQFHPLHHSFSYPPTPHSLRSNHPQDVLHSLDQSQFVAERPKHQCWDHGCNGRQFSTFSNLLRHQREKSGAATKSSCPRCGAEFTRTTARNGHMLNEKCRTRRSSEAK